MQTEKTTRGRLNFRRPTAAEGGHYQLAEAGAHQPNLSEVEEHEIEILEIPRGDSGLTLDSAGFELVARPTEVRDFLDKAEIEGVYYSEVEALVKEKTGAREVHVFDHNVRFADAASALAGGARSPVRFAHNDYTEQSGPQRVRDLLGPQNAAGRYAFVNVWRPIHRPVVDAPLALADARTLRPDQFQAVELRYGDRSGEVYAVRYHSGQRWWYAPGMQPDEAILIKGFDSKLEGVARYTAHGAFDPVGLPPGLDTRESIEVRTIVLY